MNETQLAWFAIGLAIASVSIACYFIPTFVACANNHKQRTSIFVLNFFLGWSVFGWVGALVWALIKPQNNA